MPKKGFFPPPTKFKQPKAKKNAPPPDTDDESLDSRGNVRNLIDYDYSESSACSRSSSEMEDIPKKERKPRKAAIAARKRLRRIADIPSSSDQSSDTSVESSCKRTTKKKRIVPTLVVESESEEEEKPRRRNAIVENKPKHQSKKKSKHYETEEEETEEEEEETEYETEDETEEDESGTEYDTSEDEDDDYRGKRGTLDIVISDLLGNGRDPNKPQKYNLKKESASVRRFVELVQKEDEAEDTIDNDITYFKSLAPEKQDSLLRVLEHKASPAETPVPIKFKILEKVVMKPELSRIAMAKYNALCNIDPSSTEYYKVSHWINGFTSLPLGMYRDLPVRIEDGPEKCHDFMEKVSKCMSGAIHGHDDAKLQIMQFVSNWIANPTAAGNVLSIHGPPGVGKTSLIKDGVAKGLDRPFHFITLGGATDASFLDGHSYTYEGSTWGKIVDVLIHSKCMNPVIYFDELDKVSDTPKGEEIMNMLIHLTDGSQNDRFQDKYFTGIEIDLSRCLFIFSHNNHAKVNPILRDRMYNIQVKGFSVKEKQLIASDYLIPAALKEAGLHEKVSINKEIIEFVIQNYTGEEAGVRELKRCIQTIISKINLLRFYNNPKLVPFSIEGFSLPFTIKKQHVELFLKKRETDEVWRSMYM